MKRRIGRSSWVGAAHLLFFIYYMLPTAIAAQTFTERLTRIRAGEATVSLHQDEEINALVNGLVSYAPGRTAAPKRTARPLPLQTTATDTTIVADSSACADIPMLTGRRVRMNGYRIQIYAGGDNRKSKAEAYAAAAAIRNYFDDVPVYTNFISPRWVCRIGDYKTREEAAQMLSSIRQTGAFREAFIVKTKIIALY